MKKICTKLLVYCKKLFRKSAGMLYKVLIQPNSGTEDLRRREFILNVILLGVNTLLVWSEFYLLESWSDDPFNYKGIPIGLFSAVVILFAFLYWLSRKSYFIVSSYILITLLFVSTTYAAYRWGVNLPAALLSYALLIVVVSILINSRFGVYISALVFSVILILGYRESRLLYLPELHWKTKPFVFFDAIQYSLLLFVILLVSWLSNREIEKSLTRARSSEAALKAERDSLEIKVERRTHELKQSQLERLTEMNRFAEFGRLSSGLFHDLANPLTAVSLSIEQLQNSSRTDIQKTKDSLHKAFQISKRMENLLLGARKQIQSQEVQADFFPSEEIKQIIDILHYKAVRINVEVLFGTPLNERPLHGNYLKFHQAITNIISNAIESYENVPTDKNKKVIVTMAYDKNFSIIIQDNGCGIPQEKLEKIFDPFFTTKDPNKGTGLGLSTAKAVIENDFKGTIEVTSNVETGTIFKIQIP